jgi:transposase
MKRTSSLGTIDDLFCYATQGLEYTQSATTVWRIVKSMEYRYKKGNNRKILCEKT